MLRIRAFLGANIGVLFIYFILYAVLFVFSLYLQNFLLLGLSTLSAGLVLLPITLTMFVCSLFVEQLIKPLGRKGTAGLGFLILAIGLYLVSQRSLLNSTVSDLWLPFLLIGVGLGLPAAPLLGAGVSAVREESAGEAAGLLTLSHYIGGALGVAISGSIYTHISMASVARLLQKGRLSGFERASLDKILAGNERHALQALSHLHSLYRHEFVYAGERGITQAFDSSTKLLAVAALIGLLSTVICLPRRSRRDH